MSRGSTQYPLRTCSSVTTSASGQPQWGPLPRAPKSLGNYRYQLPFPCDVTNTPKGAPIYAHPAPSNNSELQSSVPPQGELLPSHLRPSARAGWDVPHCAPPHHQRICPPVSPRVSPRPQAGLQPCAQPALRAVFPYPVTSKKAYGLLPAMVQFSTSQHYGGLLPAIMSVVQLFPHRSASH